MLVLYNLAYNIRCLFYIIRSTFLNFYNWSIMSYIPHLELILTKAKEYNTIIVSAPSGYNQQSLINGILNNYNIDANNNFINTPKLALIKELEDLTPKELDEVNAIINEDSKLLIAFTKPFSVYLIDYTNNDSIFIITEKDLKWDEPIINKLKNIYNIQGTFPEFLGGYPLACSTFIKIYSLYNKQDCTSILENFGQRFILSKFKDFPCTLLTTCILFSNLNFISIENCALFSGLHKNQLLIFVNQLISHGILEKTNTKIQPTPFARHILSTMTNSPHVNWDHQKKIANNLSYQDVVNITIANKNIIVFLSQISKTLVISFEHFNYQWILDSINQIQKYDLVSDKKLQFLKAIILLDFCNNFKEAASIIDNVDMERTDCKFEDNEIFFKLVQIRIYIYKNQFTKAEQLILDIKNNNYPIVFTIVNDLLHAYVYIYKNEIKKALNILNSILIKAEIYQMYKVKIETLYLMIRIYYYLGHLEPAKKIVNDAIKYSRSKNAGSEICTSQIYFIGGLIYLMTGYTNEANKLITFGNNIISKKTSSSSLPFMCIQLLQFISIGTKNDELHKTLYDIYTEKTLNSSSNNYNIHNSVFEMTSIIAEYKLGNTEYLQNMYNQLSITEDIKNYNDLFYNQIYLTLSIFLKKSVSIKAIDSNIKYCEEKGHNIFLLRYKLSLIILFPNKYSNDQQIEIINQIVNCKLFLLIQIFEPHIRHLLTIILTNKTTSQRTKELLRNAIANAHHFQPQVNYSNYQNLLTPKEKQISLQILARMENDEIANSLFMSKSTLRNHINHIYKKLNVKNRTEALDILSNINLSN